MLMTSSTATRGRGGKRGEEGEEGRGGTGWDRGRRSGEYRNHRVPTRATDHSRGGGPPSRSPGLTVMGDLRRKGNRERPMVRWIYTAWGETKKKEACYMTLHVM